LLALGLSHGAAVTIEAQGAGAAAAIAAIIPLLTAEVDGEAPRRAPIAAAAVAIDPDAMPGVAAAPGLAIGVACWLRPVVPDLPASGAGIAAE
ncbi:hypothetical protein, partial [Clostridium perfringens]